jgi:ferredoxin/flavodoxin---NADP+ reductase
MFNNQQSRTAATVGILPQMQTTTPVDVAIIGAGPVGLFGAFYAGLRRMSVRLLDSLQILGGQLMTLYPEKFIYDVPGFPKVLAKDLSASLVEQAMQYSPAVSLGEQVHELLWDEGERMFTITSDKFRHPARAILICAGIGAFQPKTLPLTNAGEFEGQSLHYFVRDPAVFRDQRILIVGGGDSAIDWANALDRVARSVTLIHRRDQFRAHEDAVAQMKAGRTHVMTFHELKSIEGPPPKLTGAIVYDNRTKAKQMLEVDHVLVNVGFLNSLGPIVNWGLDLQGNSIKVDQMMHTSRPGVFAAGDIVAYPGKLKLIATGFAEACTGINFAKTFIDPSARAFPGHSSEMYEKPK